jgi:hypothetical protein
MKSVRLLFLLLGVALCTVVIPVAEARSFGEPFPVTNTRYLAAYGAPRLATNDQDFFLFWAAEQKIRAARIVDGEPRVSHAVLDTNEQPFDVAWTGDRYLVVSTRTPAGPPLHDGVVVGRLLDASAHPIGPEFTIVAGDRPRIAVGANSIALLYRTPTDTRLLLLSKEGRPIGSQSRIIPLAGTSHAVTRFGDQFLAIVGTTTGVRAVTFDQQGQQVSENTLGGPAIFREVAVASDGTNALVVWCDERQAIAVTVDEHANFGAALELEHAERAGSPTAIWNGGGWTVSYARDPFDVRARTQIVQLDWRAQNILSREQSAQGNGFPTLAGLDGAGLDGEVLTAWRPVGENKSPAVARLPLASNEPRRTPYTPSQQTLLATASSPEATLTVWSENIDGGVSIHAGVRSHSGNWRELRLENRASLGLRAVAAGGEHGFVVAIANYGDHNNPSSLIQLDATGQRLADVALPFSPLVMAWNGTNYAAIGINRGVLVSPAGVVSAPVALGQDFEPRVLASDGTGFFVAGRFTDCEFLLCFTTEVMGVRLGADLKRIDPEDLILSEEGTDWFVGAVWNGSKYVTLWRDSAWRVAFVPPSPNVGIETREIQLPVGGDSMAALSDGTIAVAGRDEVSKSRSRVVFLSGAGDVLQVSDIERVTDANMAPLLERVPAGVAYIASSIQDSAPHDGASRVVTAIAKSSPVPPPAAPHVGVKVQNGNILIDWTAPAGTVNGYRLEYRVDDDSWNEYEQWFGPDVQRKSIRKPAFGTQFAFRVRAFNDGGASDYSAPAVTSPSRRRAVR